MPPRRGRCRSCRVSVDEKAEFAYQELFPPPPSDPQVPPTPPTTPAGMFPPVSPEVFQAFMAYWYAQAQAQTQAGQGPFPIPPQMPQAASAEQSAPKLSKLIKEARQLGCESFFGTVNAVVAKNWLKRVTNTVNDMGLDDESKLKVATRLLEQSATTWWENLKLRSPTPLTWDDFIREFNNEYFDWFHRDEKRQEFFRLKQYGKTVTEYETQLRELLEFVPELAVTKEYLCSKFEEGLSLEIREKMPITGSQSYKEVVQLALRAEKLTSERRTRGNFQKRNGSNFVPGQSSKKSRSFDSSGNSSGFGFGFINSPQSTSCPTQPSRFGISAASTAFGGKQIFGLKRCQNCQKFHTGPCQEPHRCFHCGQPAHYKNACPNLVGRGSVGQIGQGQTSVQRAGQTTVRPSVTPTFAIGAGSASGSQGTRKFQTRTQARVFAMTADEAQANPDTVTGPNTATGGCIRRGKTEGT
ncbi:hypothetical protein REPUB_Repub06bG0122200 [Reevesia pubescens]